MSFTKPNPLAPAEQAKPPFTAGSGRRHILPPEADCFARRARRALAVATHSTGLKGYLTLLAHLASTQQRMLNNGTTHALPLQETPRPTPPLNLDSLGVRHTLKADLLEIVESLTVEPQTTLGLKRQIAELSLEQLRTQALALCNGDIAAVDGRLATPLAAALQIDLVGAALHLPADFYSTGHRDWLCPGCGAHPVSSLMLSGGDQHGMRFLCCPMCSVQWHRVRAHCVVCDSSEHVAYYSVSEFPGVRAETCSTCRVYIKVQNRETTPEFDPIIDDLATLALDVLLADDGYARVGVNPFLLPGQSA